ncbi:hypothetical protein RJ639_022840 [Escallonia herrerae]|uniref:TmcB/TmcC TPR repeats domain-containing protein n=1 Tax=Escallonia herrerae TaxID=1293975 RepID=A0AA88V2K9_9ASTE|nr:hypothetical protein RJ639_022840 [Escallonia herrerae]
MLLRSSSTPVLGSLLSSITESPNHHYQPELVPPTHTTTKHPPTTVPHSCQNKLSFHQSGSQNFSTFSCNSSPISLSEYPTTGRRTPTGGFRRAQSEGNLESLANASGNNCVDEFSMSVPMKKFPRRPNCSLLQTIPSFSFHNSTAGNEDEYSDEEEEEFEEKLERTYDTVGGGLHMEQNMRLKEDMRYVNSYGNVGLEAMGGGVSQQMYLARGLGVTGVEFSFGSGCGVNGGGSTGCGSGSGGGGRGDGGDGDGKNLEEHYKRLVEENPSNPLFLRNYAEFLYQSKGDLQGADEYYSRAILADPNDGEILSQYAKLVWELHHDEDRATSYFERAVQAADEDSHVHAAYANFLWGVEDDEDGDDESLNYSHAVPPFLHKGAMASATA